MPLPLPQHITPLISSGVGAGTEEYAPSFGIDFSPSFSVSALFGSSSGGGAVASAGGGAGSSSGAHAPGIPGPATTAFAAAAYAGNALPTHALRAAVIDADSDGHGVMTASEAGAQTLIAPPHLAGPKHRATFAAAMGSAVGFDVGFALDHSTEAIVGARTLNAHKFNDAAHHHQHHLPAEAQDAIMLDVAADKALDATTQQQRPAPQRASGLAAAAPGAGISSASTSAIPQWRASSGAGTGSGAGGSLASAGYGGGGGSGRLSVSDNSALRRGSSATVLAAYGGGGASDMRGQASPSKQQSQQQPQLPQAPQQKSEATPQQPEAQSNSQARQRLPPTLANDANFGFARALEARHQRSIANGGIGLEKFRLPGEASATSRTGDTPSDDSSAALAGLLRMAAGSGGSIRKPEEPDYFSTNANQYSGGVVQQRAQPSPRFTHDYRHVNAQRWQQQQHQLQMQMQMHNGSSQQNDGRMGKSDSNASSADSLGSGSRSRSNSTPQDRPAPVSRSGSLLAEENRRRSLEQQQQRQQQQRAQQQVQQQTEQDRSPSPIAYHNQTIIDAYGPRGTARTRQENISNTSSTGGGFGGFQSSALLTPGGGATTTYGASLRASGSGGGGGRYDFAGGDQVVPGSYHAQGMPRSARAGHYQLSGYSPVALAFAPSPADDTETPTTTSYGGRQSASPRGHKRDREVDELESSPPSTRSRRTIDQVSRHSASLAWTQLTNFRPLQDQNADSETELPSGELRVSISADAESSQRRPSRGKAAQKNADAGASGSAAAGPSATQNNNAAGAPVVKKRKNRTRPAPFVGDDGRKRYPCGHPGCDKTFSTSGHAARHNRIHAGEHSVGF